MKTSQFFFNPKTHERCEVWYEYLNKRFHYWLRTSEGSEVLTKRRFLNIVKKYNLKKLEI